MEKLARMSTGSRGKIIRLVGPVASVAAANIANISLMRQNEFLEGIDVMDEVSERSERALRKEDDYHYIISLNNIRFAHSLPPTSLRFARYRTTTSSAKVRRRGR